MRLDPFTICPADNSIRPSGQPSTRIDPAVKDLVDRMNATGRIRTVGSCQGHALGQKPPYVYFRTSVHIAAAIERSLRNIAACDERALNFLWVVEGCFNQDYKLAFLLYSPEQHRRAESLLSLLPFGDIRRRRVNADLSSLAQIVEEAVLPYIGEQSEPEIPQSHEDNEGAECPD